MLKHKFPYNNKSEDKFANPGEFLLSSAGDKVIEIIETWRVISKLQWDTPNVKNSFQ
jgi:hypothetical protein